MNNKHDEQQDKMAKFPEGWEDAPFPCCYGTHAADGKEIHRDGCAINQHGGEQT